MSATAIQTVGIKEFDSFAIALLTAISSALSRGERLLANQSIAQLGPLPRLHVLPPCYKPFLHSGSVFQMLDCARRAPKHENSPASPETICRRGLLIVVPCGLPGLEERV
jgi:hypothetical protein